MLLLLFFVRLFLFFKLVLLWFAFLCAQNIFVKKIEIFLITSFTILLTCTPVNPPMESLFVHTSFHLWESPLFMRIFFICEKFFLLWESLSFLYENKQTYEILSFKANLLSSKHDNGILLILYAPILCFLFLEFFSFCVWLLFY